MVPLDYAPPPRLTPDFHYFIPEPPSIITEASWIERDRLAAKHYPQIMDLLAFGESHLIDILIDVECDEKPPAEFPVGAAGSASPLAWLPKRSWLEWHLFRGIAPAARRPTISPGLRAAVIARDGYVCQLCGLPVDPSDVHIDHIKPHSKGGATVLGNLQVTHSRCNLMKGARV